MNKPIASWILQKLFPTILIWNSISGQQRQAPLVQTTLGPIIGQQYTTKGGVLVNGYMNVPYSGQPPRFGRSTPKTPWTQVFNASDFGAICMQSVFQGEYSRPLSEDCLFLKILVPAARAGDGNLFPIIYWPVGGGFKSSDNEYDPDKQADVIVSKGVCNSWLHPLDHRPKVIMVQPNTRPQTYGFWSTGQADAPGNYAFWDLYEGLKYLRANAMNFGGDPRRIVLGGQGAGALAAEGLSLSPLTRGMWGALFMLSASVFNPQLNLDPNVQLQRYQRMATAAGCDDAAGTKWNSGQRSGILQCMKNKDPRAMIAAINNTVIDSSLYYGPRVDGVGGFFPYPFETLARMRPNTPVMTGTTDHEYAWDLVVRPDIFLNKGAVFPPNVDSLDTVTKTCSKVATNETYPRNYQQVRDACVQRYGNNRTLQALSVQQPPQQQGQMGFLQNAIKAGSGMVYWGPVMQDVGYMLANGNNRVYLYSMDYARPEVSQWWREVGSFHNFDMFFIENFTFPFYNFTPNANDNQIGDMWSEFLTNFAKFGNPAPAGSRYRWRPTNGRSYFSFNAPTSPELDNYHTDDVGFWNNYVTNLGRSNPYGYATNLGIGNPYGG